MSATFTREEKTRVIELARELGVSATALYRELNTALPTRERETVREVMEVQTIREVKRDHREISRAVTVRCSEALAAARTREPARLARRVLVALPGKGVLLTAGTDDRVLVSAITDRRGTLELVATVEVIPNRAGCYLLTLTGATEPRRVMEAELMDALAAVLPARLDTTPERFRDKLRPKTARGVNDPTGERATPGTADGAEFSTIARPARRGTRGLTEAHKREITRQRVARHRAKVRAARIAADGRTHALRAAEVATVGTEALAAPKPVLVTEAAPVYRRPAPEPGKTIAQLEAEAARELRAIAKAAREAVSAEAVTVPAVPVTVPAPVPAPVPVATSKRAAKRAAIVADTDKETAEIEKFRADMRAANPELFPEADGTLF